MGSLLGAMFIELIQGNKEVSGFRWQIEVSYVFPGLGCWSLSPDSSCRLLCGPFFIFPFKPSLAKRCSQLSLIPSAVLFSMHF